MKAPELREKLENFRAEQAKLAELMKTKGDQEAMLAIAIGSVSTVGILVGEIALQLAELNEGLKKGDFTITRMLP